MENITVTELNSLLSKLQKNREDQEAAKNFYQKGVAYFAIQNVNSCWWCNPETADAALEMLHLFSLIVSPDIVTYKDALAQCLSRYYKIYDRSLVDNFFKEITEWDTSRILDTLSKTPQGDVFKVPTIVLDALMSIDVLLYNRKIINSVCAHISEYQSRGSKLSFGSRAIPGLVPMCFHEDASISEWAIRSIKISILRDSPIDTKDLACIFAKPFSMLATKLGHPNYCISMASDASNWSKISGAVTFPFSIKDIYQRLRPVFGRLGKAAVKGLVEELDGVPVILSESLMSASDADFVNAVRCFAEVLISVDNGEKLWKTIESRTSRSPADIARLITVHPAAGVIRYITNDVGDKIDDSSIFLADRALKPITDWMIPFIESLTLPEHYAAIEVILNHLFVTVKVTAGVPIAYVATCVYKTLGIIKHYLKQPQSGKSKFANGEFILSKFLETNIEDILALVQGESTLSDNELLIGASEDLIELALKDDLGTTIEGISQLVRNAGPSGIGRTSDGQPSLLLQYPKLWQGVLREPRNTNIVRHAMGATSYLLLLDSLPQGLLNKLDKEWQDIYLQFGSDQARIVNDLERFMLVAMGSIESADSNMRKEFESLNLSALLRYLSAPSSKIRGIVMDMLQPGTGYDMSTIVDETDCDMLCYDLYQRHGDKFFASLTEVASDCIGIVDKGIPAFTCCAYSALLGRSSISALSDLGGSGGQEEMMAQVFFTYCNMLTSILKVSSNGARQSGRGESGYANSVVKVFQTVYNMFNMLEFSEIVKLVKDSSSRLDESETMDSMSTCMSQMLNYLEAGDELEIANEIIKMFGLVSGGLAATPGASMLYPGETVRSLVDGRKGVLSTEQRRMLASITQQPVWESRSVLSSITRPVQIIFDDDVILIDDESILDLIDDIDSTVDKPVPQSNQLRAEQNKSSKSLGSGTLQRSGQAAEVVISDGARHTQLTARDEKAAMTKRNVSLIDWFKRANPQGKTLTSSGKKPPHSGGNSSTATKTGSSKGKKPASGGMFSISSMRSDFAKERNAMHSVHKPAALQVKAKQTGVPRALSTVPVSKWDSRRAMDVDEPEEECGGPAVEILVRDASREALLEQRRVQEQQNALSSSRVPSGSNSSSSDSESGSDESDREASAPKAKRSGLAGLMSVHRSPGFKALPKKSIKFIDFNELGGVRRGAGGAGGLFFDQEARDRAIAEQRTRMRLTPNIDALHKQILSWEYEKTGDCPPEINKLSLSCVGDRFEDAEAYNKAFESLFLLECWAQFQHAKEETTHNDVGVATMVSRMSVDDFQDITMAIPVAYAKDVIENDVLVLAESITQEKQYVQGDVLRKATQNKRIDEQFERRSTFLAKVQSRAFGKDRTQVVLRTYFRGPRLALFINRLTINSSWEFSNLWSLTPMHREFAALRSLPYLDADIMREILDPRLTSPAVHGKTSRNEIERYMRTHALNQPQAEAVVSAVRREHGFTLIQGPPGTGKTKTILGLAGALLAMVRKGEGKNNKLLVCAPSNAAVDEIVKRLKSGIRDSDGRTFVPRVVRVGLADSISSTVRDTTLDYLVEKALNTYSDEADGAVPDDVEDSAAGISNIKVSDVQSDMLHDITDRRKSSGKAVRSAMEASKSRVSAIETQRELRRQLGEINSERKDLDEQMQRVDASNTREMQELRDKFRQVNQRKRQICQQLDAERERAKSADKTIDATRHKIRLQILTQTDILCCTLSGSGHDILTSMNCVFDTVIIDEAAQSVELSCLIPLKYGCERCILVGDPNQLPPTVLSQKAAQHKYNQSMFVRIQRSRPESVNLLSIQYRMHPEISAFPSKHFYKSRLRDGPSMETKQAAEWHKGGKYPPFAFLNVWRGREERGRSQSLFNTAEAEAAVGLVQSLSADYPNLSLKQKIGVITPYKQQLRVIVNKFVGFFGSAVMDAIEFNTVDGFQGQEKDIIIFSCVRANGKSGVGFLADERRMNVGITRARKSLFVLGNSDMLSNNSPLWRELIDDAKGRGLLRDSTFSKVSAIKQDPAKYKNLLSDSAQDKRDALVDGEGSRSEFIMEKFDEVAFEKFSTATSAQCAADGSGDDANANKRPRKEGEEPNRNIASKKRKPAPSAMTQREKQRSCLFIPKKTRPGAKKPVVRKASVGAESKGPLLPLPPPPPPPDSKLLPPPTPDSKLLPPPSQPSQPLEHTKRPAASAIKLPSASARIAKPPAGNRSAELSDAQDNSKRRRRRRGGGLFRPPIEDDNDRTKRRARGDMLANKDDMAHSYFSRDLRG